MIVIFAAYQSPDIPLTILHSTMNNAVEAAMQNDDASEKRNTYLVGNNRIKNNGLVQVK